jgi:ubiquinone/menaquinone biosynthesis C-methylase UbiE
MKQIYKYIAQQFGNPTGLGGKISTFIMNCLNRKQYNAVIKNIDIQATDTILDIGFGNGFLIRRLSNKNFHKIYGIDISPDMLKTATGKNRKKIEQGKIELRLADVQDLPFDNSSIDKVYTINTIYFWQDINKGFSEIKRVLKPNGIFLNVVYSKEWLSKLPITQYGFEKYSISELEKITKDNGMKIVEINEIVKNKSYCIISENI